jgi:MraZ protein
MLNNALFLICLGVLKTFCVKLCVLKWGEVDYFITLRSRTCDKTKKYLVEMQFLGNFDAKIDAKMRVFVPANFRKVLQASAQSILILRKDIFQNCLVLYPESVWEQEIQRLRSRLSRWDKLQQQLFRQFVVDAERLELDASGRILVPKRCLQLIGGNVDIQFLGVDNTIEIWVKGQLQASLTDASSFAAEIELIMNNDGPDDK